MVNAKNVGNDKLSRNLVSIVKSSYSDVYQNLPQAINLAGGMDPSHREKIIVKVNLCDARTPDTGAISHPVFLDALLKFLREQFGEKMPIYVVESDGRVVIADLFVKWFGLLPIIEKWGARWVNLSREESVLKEFSGFKFNKMLVPKIFEDAYFITMPKLKTNILTTMTCCLKNQHGCNPLLNKQQFHDYIDDAICAENYALGMPDFCVVDGIVGVGGIWGPSFGPPIHSKLIIAGRDAVSVDCVCAKIMGLIPKRVKHIRLAIKKGLGCSNYEVVGESLDAVKQNFQWNGFQARLFRLAQRFQAKEFRKIRHEA